MLSFVRFGKQQLNRRTDGGEGWIRTSVRLRGQIYSLLPLTTRPPLQACHAQPVGGTGEHGEQAAHMAMSLCGVNWCTIVCDAHQRSAMPPAWRFWSG